MADVFPLDIKGKCNQNENNRVYLFQIETLDGEMEIIQQNNEVESDRQ